MLKKTEGIRAGWVGDEHSKFASLVERKGAKGRGDTVYNFLMTAPSKRFKFKPSSVSCIVAMTRPIMMRRMISELATVGCGKVVVVCGEMTERDYYGWDKFRGYRTNRIDEADERFDRDERSEHFHKSGVSEYIITGMTQARTTLPMEVKVLKMKEFGRWLKSCHDFGARGSEYGCRAEFKDSIRVVPHLDESGEAADLMDEVCRCVNDRSAGGGSVKGYLFAIGPERGWTISEIEAMKDAGFKVVTMGEGVMKVQTAAVVCCKIGDMLVGKR